MNGQYYRWTMTTDGREKRFITQDVGPDFWSFTDTAQPSVGIIRWRTGDTLVMRDGEQDEIIGHPTRIEVLGFDAETVGVRGGIKMRARVLEASELSRGSYDVGSEHTFDSEVARGAYRFDSRAAALVA